MKFMYGRDEIVSYSFHINYIQQHIQSIMLTRKVVGLMLKDLLLFFVCRSIVLLS